MLQNFFNNSLILFSVSVIHLIYSGFMGKRISPVNKLLKNLKVLLVEILALVFNIVSRIISYKG